MEERQPTEIQKEEILADLESKVRALTPEMIQSPENAERIYENFRDGVIQMALFMISDAEESGKEPQDHAFEYAWPLKDLARTILTNPLPEEQVWAHYADNPDEAPLEVTVADETDWWEKLDEGQKSALLQVLGLDWEAVKDYEPKEEDIHTPHIIYRGEDASIKDAQIERYIAYPSVIWQPHHEIVVTAVPFALSEEE